MKTDELTGAALDWAVAKCEGYTCLHKTDGRMPHEPQLVMWPPRKAYGLVDLWELGYSTDWSLAGPIIERERMGVWFSDAVIEADGTVDRDKCYYAEDKDGDHVQTGPTSLIAAMRCYVESKLGAEIKLPEELK